MIQLEEIKKYLLSNLSEKRYMHSLNTAVTASSLADALGEDSEKAFIAGLVHDCTRETDITIQQSMLESLGVQVDSLIYNTSELLHAFSAEFIIRNRFELQDETIIAAVRFHTTGKENMTPLEKIIFLSDVIEPSRSFPGVEIIRQLSKQDLDQALIAAFDSSIRFLVGKRALIHPNTVSARNFIINSLQK